MGWGWDQNCRRGSEIPFSLRPLAGNVHSQLWVIGSPLSRRGTPDRPRSKSGAFCGAIVSRCQNMASPSRTKVEKLHFHPDERLVDLEGFGDIPQFLRLCSRRGSFRYFCVFDLNTLGIPYSVTAKGNTIFSSSQEPEATYISFFSSCADRVLENRGS